MENIIKIPANSGLRPEWSIAFLALVILVSAGCNGHDGNGTDADADVDAGEDISLDETETEAEDGIEPSEVDGEDADGPVDSVDDDLTPDLEDVEEEEEIIVTGCGDGIVEGAEVCDDGNRETENCGRWEDCLGDCSLFEASCGNGHLDPGEECDDGNADSMDYCTTSCNINDHGIGSPCECPNCYGINVNREPIYGCEGVDVPPDSGGVLSCIHTMVEPYSGYEFYAPEGYCTIGALKCLGDEIDCQEVENMGDVDSFSCPPGYPYFGVSCTGTGGIGIVLKLCLRPCSSPSQCRWNGFDENQLVCGHQDCIPSLVDPSQKVCFDSRNFLIDLPDIECENI